MSAPIVAYQNGAYIITFFRAEGAIGLKEEKWVFDNHHVSIHGCYPHEFAKGERMPDGPVATDGLLYYVYAKPRDGGEEIFVWLETKDHAMILRHTMDIIHSAEEAAYRAKLAEEGDAVCTFCWKRPSEGCSEDHGDEMRADLRAALEGSN